MERRCSTTSAHRHSALVYCTHACTYSTGALDLLDGPALDAVLAHERHHASRHDPLRLACGRVLAAGLFFIPSLVVWWSASTR